MAIGVQVGDRVRLVGTGWAEAYDGYGVGDTVEVVEIDEYGAIGSGGGFAMAAMHLGKTPEQAVDVARELDLFSGGRTEGMTV